MANELALRNALREKLANELTHRNSLSAGGGVSEPVERLGILPPWYQTLSGERAGQGFTEALQAINQNRGDLQIGDTTINPLDFVNPIAGATVWHGSPHRFDRFDMSKIGTGEGAQAYGHGLYFADTPDVAKTYMQSSDWRLKPMRDMSYMVDGKPMSPMDVDEGLLYHYKMTDLDLFAQRLQHLEAQKTASLKQAEYYAQQAKSGEDAERYARMEKVARKSADKFANELALAERLKTANVEPAAGALYKVDLPDDQIANMLDWDAPLTQQPEAVRKAILSTGIDESVLPYYTGQQFYEGEVRAMTELDGLPKGEARHRWSSKLKELGIPGIKYFDGGSRAAGEGTRNYVVFDDSLPKILERNGEAMRYGDGPAMSAGNRWYHGTLNDFDDFEVDDIYQNTFRPVDDAVWLTDSPAYASWINEKKAGKVLNDGRVLDVQADVSNPLKIDILAEGRRVADEIGADLPETAMEAQELLSGGMGWDAVVAQWIHEAKMAGHDALELANFHDNWSINAGKTTNAMLVFDPKKAKIIK